MKLILNVTSDADQGDGNYTAHYQEICGQLWIETTSGDCNKGFPLCSVKTTTWESSVAGFGRIPM